jgi:hypothetical protein
LLVNCHLHYIIHWNHWCLFFFFRLDLLFFILSFLHLLTCIYIGSPPSNPNVYSFGEPWFWRACCPDPI